MRNISDKICGGKKQNILFSATFFSPENHAVYEIM